MSLIDTRFQVDESKCVGCGLCQLACPSMLIEMNEHKKPSLKPVKSMDWYGCWGCQHCLTVCPNGAISVLGKKPENSLPLPSDAISEDLERLVCSRRSCRHYKDENVDPELLNELLAALEATPTGGNKQKMEFTVIDDRAELDKLRKMICEGVKDLKKQGIYPYSWDEESYGIMEARGPQAMNGDIYFCSAPHIIIPHMPKKFGSAAVEVGITLAYFELLCESKGLGCVYLGFPMNVMKLLPDVWAKLGIPEDHFVATAMGFGYPKFDYARGAQKSGKQAIHRLKF